MVPKAHAASSALSIQAVALLEQVLEVGLAICKFDPRMGERHAPREARFHSSFRHSGLGKNTV
jgi:hypothetical protein